MRRLDTEKVKEATDIIRKNFDNPTYVSFSRHIDGTRYEIRVSWADDSHRIIYPSLDDGEMIAASREGKSDGS